MSQVQTHRIQIGSVVRDLPIDRPPGKPFRVAVFDMLSDYELVEAVAAELVHLIPRDAEFLIMPYGKAQALLHELGMRTGLPTVIARKEKRFYMKDVVSVGGVQSMTTEQLQEYHLRGIDVAKIRGKKGAFVDDVVSTGGSRRSLKALLDKDEVRAELIATIAAFTEGDEEDESVLHLGHLPLFHDK